ncbi:4-hydroxy-3-methylbut-2-enyl diphosphate reductase [Skermanella mucosa]|uniref:4-hydroxy-3-methylbut-2-enyl diphosphate reductase n=1 Tax=Skermanella mucosa TaxID=1789672 RepID=UPI00192B7744|nr:4-hydroxy-3-methylbut-2-enyl diphosphate reductase [Skermanella mucosa]UEM22214.1 4-hydroxy-3-methylbut-2-enyl diphosphate reductase [Skermanella mucosa]
MQVILAQPRGFCAGVERAIEIVERALALYGPPVYVRHEIVHNGHVVERLRAKGVRFVDEVDEVPPGGVTIFSAHGVSTSVDEAARARGLHIIDATCPLVARVHLEGARYSRQGRDVVLIGHAGHAEVEGTLGRLKGPVHLVGSVEDVAGLEVSDPGRVAYITQTTLSIDDTRSIIEALKARFPAIVGPDTNDICYATQNRQRAVLSLAPLVDLVLVVGAANSSNSNRLREIAQDAGVPAHLIDDASALDPAWLEGVSSVGVTAGASAPEDLVQEVLAALSRLTMLRVMTLPGIEETLRFRLPAELEAAGPGPLPRHRSDMPIRHEDLNRK